VGKPMLHWADIRPVPDGKSGSGWDI